ncbi:NAD(P)-dependent oxidoreductase [Mycoplasmatota bacterium WC30]
MKIFMIGGTGLIGSVAAKKLLDKGHYVTSLALPPIPKGALIPQDMKLILKNFMNMTDAELIDIMHGSQGFVFAAGVDERIEGKAPIYDMFYKYNIAPLERLLKLAKQAGVKKAVILGSYFSYFARTWEDLNLYEEHPYIRSRVDQANMALSFSDENMSVSVLELPYIFGVQEGRKPVWVLLVEQIRKMKYRTFYPGGGTSMVTIDQVGQLIANVLETETNGNIPVGYYNMTWKEMLNIFHEHMGINRKIVTVPKWLYKIGLGKYKRRYKKAGFEPGLTFDGLAEIMSRNAFINKDNIVKNFNIKEDDIEKAIGDSIKLSLEILDGKEEIVDMKLK